MTLLLDDPLRFKVTPASRSTSSIHPLLLDDCARLATTRNEKEGKKRNKKKRTKLHQNPTIMAGPLKPHWQQPSHPEIQQVVFGTEGDFTSKSLSKTKLAPFAVFADMSFPPCTLADESTYATVQIGRDKHISLNSDLLYLNHSCEPSLVSAV